MKEQVALANETEKSVIKSTGLMTVATLGSRLAGLARTWVMAFALGNTMITSAYQVANNLPNVIYELVAGGLLSAAFLPVLLLETEKHGKQGGNRYSSNILNLTLIVLGVLALLAAIFAEPLVSTQTFTIDSDTSIYQEAVEFFRLFAIQIVFYGLGGVITGILNAQRSYLLTSIAPALNNIFVIVSLLLYIPWSQSDPSGALIMLGIGTSLGVIAQFVIQVPALIKHGFTWMPVIDLKDPALRETFKIAVPTLIYIVSNLVAFSCRNAFSLTSGDMGPSTLNYAWTWYQLPYGVVAVSLSRAMFTEMSSAVAKSDWGSLRSYVRKGLSGTLFLIIPLMAALILLASPLITLFRSGAFTENDVHLVTDILQLWAVSLPFYSLVMYLYNTFASIRRFMPFAIMNCILVAVQVGLYALFSSNEVFGLSGIPVADFVYYACGLVVAVLLLRHYIGGFGFTSVIWLGVRVAIASVGGIIVGAIFSSLFNGVAYGNPLMSLVQIIVVGCICLTTTFLLCRVLRVKETEIVTGMFKAIARRFRH